MDINKLTAMADRLSIPQLQQAMRDGSLPAYVGMPILQQKVQEAKQAQAAQAAGKPQAPTVASQVEGEADQHEMMKRQALAMQAQMAGTGGISDMLRKPEPEAMAKGGAVAFNGEDESYVQDIYTKLANGVPLTGKEKQILATRPVNPPTRPYINLAQPYTGPALPINRQVGELNIPAPIAQTASAQTEQPQYAAEPKRYRNVLPTEDVTTPKKAYTPSPMPEMQGLTKQMLADSIKGVDIPPYAPTNIQDQDIAVQPQPAVRGIAPLAPGMAETLGVLNQGAAGDARSMAERMQLRQAPAAQQGQGQGRTPYSPAVAPQSQLSAPAQAAAQTLAAEATPQADKPRSNADYVNELKDVLGEGKSNAALKDYLEQQGKDYAESKDKAPWMALMQAGLATMAGTSPFALANIGAGGIQGLKAYTEDVKDLRKEQDKAKELQIKAAQLQDERDLAIAKFGVESKHSDDIQARQDRNTDKQIASHEKIAQLQADVTRAGHAITAAGLNRPTEGTFQKEMYDALVAKGVPKDEAAKQVLAAGNPSRSGVDTDWHALTSLVQLYKTEANKKGVYSPADKAAQATRLADLNKQIKTLQAKLTGQVAPDSMITPPPATGIQETPNDILKQYGIQ